MWDHVADKCSSDVKIDGIGSDAQRWHVVVLLHRDVRPLPALLPRRLPGKPPVFPAPII